MTHEQATELERAITRATIFGIEVVGKGFRRSDHAQIFCTTSHSEPDRWHVVVLAGKRLVCDCKSRSYCTHKASVHMFLLTQAARREAFAEEVREAAEEEEKGQARTAKRRDLRVVRAQAPFSLLKH
jgi:hypothetical protein